MDIGISPSSRPATVVNAQPPLENPLRYAFRHEVEIHCLVLPLILPKPCMLRFALGLTCSHSRWFLNHLHLTTMKFVDVPRLSPHLYRGANAGITDYLGLF